MKVWIKQDYTGMKSINEREARGKDMLRTLWKTSMGLGHMKGRGMYIIIKPNVFLTAAWGLH